MPKDTFDYPELIHRIRHMTARTTFFKTLKFELTLKGYWKNKPRGNPAKGYLGFKASEANL